MTPRIRRPGDGMALITGASTGIGRAVALEMAARGWRVAAVARNADALAELARDSAGAIVAHPCDVTDFEAFSSVARSVEAEHGPIAFAFLNAGRSIHMTVPDFDVAAIRAIYEVNVLGVFNGVAALLPLMTGRRAGQIALCASVAGYGGLPRSTAYSSSKAAVISAAVGLAIDCRPYNLLIQCVNPGFVDTPLTRKNTFPMPFLMTPEAAAKRCVDGFERGGFEITFPRRLSYFLKFINLLPYSLYIRLMGFARTGSI
jgi:NAD(P)-dependent dehydrogenase (short-subunit alcohol dehydrogenase family)